MGYSKNPRTAIAMLKELRPLLDGTAVCYRTSPDRTAWMRYRLYDALQATRYYRQYEGPEREELAQLSALADSVQFKVVSDREIIARPKEPATIEVTLTEVMPFTTVQTEGALDELQIMYRWQNRGEQKKMYFPYARLSEAQMQNLYALCSANDVLLFEADGALTLVEWDEDLADEAWRPE